MSDYNDNGDETPQDDFEEQIKRMMRASPFQPFEIILTSGDRYRVISEFSLAIGETTMSTLYPPKGGQSYFRKSQIIGIEVPEPAA